MEGSQRQRLAVDALGSPVACRLLLAADRTRKTRRADCGTRSLAKQGPDTTGPRGTRILLGGRGRRTSAPEHPVRMPDSKPPKVAQIVAYDPTRPARRCRLPDLRVIRFSIDGFWFRPTACIPRRSNRMPIGRISRTSFRASSRAMDDGFRQPMRQDLRHPAVLDLVSGQHRASISRRRPRIGFHSDGHQGDATTAPAPVEQTIRRRASPTG